MEVIIIAAMAAHRVIGRNNILPWRIPAEMAHFRAVTMGHPVIKGRRTFQSIGGPLAGRRSIVLSADPDFRPPQAVLVCPSLTAALALCAGEEKVFLIGGQQSFGEGMNIADTILLSVIDLEIEGDTYFPEISSDRFQLVASRQLAATPPVQLETYRRIAQ